MSEGKAPNRFVSIPPELLNKIYGYRFGLEDTKVTKKVYLKRPWSPRDQLTYVFPTALLRVNRRISQGAQGALYNNNLFVLIRLTNTIDDIETAVLDKSQHFPIGFVPDKRSLPSCPVIVHHRRHEMKRLDRPGSLAIVIRAFDFPKLCKILDRYGEHYEVERASYSLMALPKAGWPREQLRSLIWEPLRDLRQSIVRGCPHGGMSRAYYKIKVVEATVTFEPTNNLLVWEPESQHEDPNSEDSEAYSNDDSGHRGCPHGGMSRAYYKIKVVEATGTFEPTNDLLVWEPESQHEDPNSEDSEAYSNDDSGHRTELDCDQECLTNRGCRLDYETEDSDWSSEEKSNSREDPDSKAESYSEVHDYTSETETLEIGTLGGDEETYLGDDELGDDRS